jgi:hypothetical protein
MRDLSPAALALTFIAAASTASSGSIPKGDQGSSQVTLPVQAVVYRDAITMVQPLNFKLPTVQAGSLSSVDLRNLPAEHFYFEPHSALQYVAIPPLTFVPYDSGCVIQAPPNTYDRGIEMYPRGVKQPVSGYWKVFGIAASCNTTNLQATTINLSGTIRPLNLLGKVRK